MKKLKKLRSNVTFRKAKQKFNVYDLDNYDFEEELQFDGDEKYIVYLFSNRWEGTDSIFHHAIYYCGKTKVVESRFAGHHKADELIEKNPNCISIHKCNTEKEMNDLEIELTELYRPELNIQNNPEYHELEE